MFLQASVVKQPYTLYVLDIFKVDLKRFGLYEVVRATCFGINISIPTFYAIMKM